MGAQEQLTEEGRKEGGRKQGKELVAVPASKRQRERESSISPGNMKTGKWITRNTKEKFGIFKKLSKKLHIKLLKYSRKKWF